MKHGVEWLRRLFRSKSEYSPEIGLSLDKATEFYLGMYQVEDEERYGTCWLKQSVDGWRISINNHSLIKENTLAKRRFKSIGCTYFKTKEDAIEEFKKWVVVRAELLYKEERKQ